MSVVLLGFACGSVGSLDAGGGRDAGSEPFDAGTIDAVRDAGAVDAGLPLPDAGIDGGDAGTDAGCTNGSHCESGVCLSTNNCFNCQGDEECSAGQRCGTGVCADSCVTAATCAPGRDCCGGRCVDRKIDPGHCGQCGQSCAPHQFCGAGTCRTADFSQLCVLPMATVLVDEIAEDDDAGVSMGAGLAAACVPSLNLRTAGQADAGVLRVTDGAPLQLGELLVVGGGSFRQGAVRWLEAENQALVRDTSTTTDAIYSLRDGGVVSTVAFATLGPGRDQVVVQVVRAPSGALVLHAAGFFGPGTLAAAYYFVQTVLPLRASLSTRWYVIEWEDLDATGGPTAPDRYTLIASGT